MEPFASVEDYRRAYPSDETEDGVLHEVLMEATDVMCAAMDSSDIEYMDPCEPFTFRLMRICRTVAHRAIGSGSAASDMPYGAQKHSWTEDVYTESVELANPYGDLFLTQAEKDALGIGVARACVVSPYG
jgi:hypothetical protein